MQTTSGFSLASVLLFTAVVAVLLAAVRMGLMVGEKPQTAIIAAAAGGGAVVGMAVGLAIGYREPRRLQSILLGLTGGSVAGPAAGVLMVLPAAAIAVLLGSLLLVLFAMVVRRLSAER
jgi:hypothetical protein